MELCGIVAGWANATPAKQRRPAQNKVRLFND
jgi:hypothetical protein